MREHLAGGKINTDQSRLVGECWATEAVWNDKEVGLARGLGSPGLCPQDRGQSGVGLSPEMCVGVSGHLGDILATGFP